ncbi:hypothetical protein OBBRIDRAFT_738413 [Obba rivulosa]|uniref:Zona occludens toxin N-terminal domain-containing protein n=1 Tax=Obba rivulosa TaxID=1052685 RepID=A0A8E2AT48_9APHY|nr:hypothetical protein OBBRIDRAFT_738413 [Obba rivulosa]
MLNEHPSFQEEYELLEHLALDERDAKDHELRTAPVLTRDAYDLAGAQSSFPQRGVLGSVLKIYDKSHESADQPEDSRLYVNTNAPFSAIVCGVQGSGKSHTVSVLLEDMLIPDCRRIGTLAKPLSGLVLHFGEGGPYSQACEAAWLGVPRLASIKPPHIRAYVSSSSLNTMRAVYAKVGSHVTVEPLLFSESELDAQAFLSMMAVGTSDSASVPLYMHIILSILRELGENYSYQSFMTKLDAKKRTFNPQQLTGLEQRLALLESFLDKKGIKKHRTAPTRFAAGQLTIVDLSDPFIDPAAACGFFEIVVRLFVRAQVNTGKVLVVDEAHKYLSPQKGPSASGLTKELLSLIRQQRHQAMRVIISTQEPTVVPPVLLDLCSVTILHRFSSPSWWDHVAKHVSAEVENSEAFDRVVSLQTGQAILLAASGLGTSRISAGPDAEPRRILHQFGRGSLLIKTRKRVTQDGGASLLVVDN